MDASVFFALLALVCGLLAVIAATVWWPVPNQPPDGELPLTDVERRGVTDGPARQRVGRFERARRQRLVGHLDADVVSRGSDEAEARVIRRIA
ncbi:hypothetical protein [Nocardia sp. bgisy134]|uniref:hypothetical protein n=1 Tax=unclassified Nocardia TaxID=2637762 RepID=UPI003D764BBE